MIFDPVAPPWLLVSTAVVVLGLLVVALVRAPGRLRLGWGLRVAMVLLVLVIALRPILPATGSGPAAVGGLEVYFVIDTTSSMAAEDADRPAVDGAPATRLDGVRDDVAAVTGALTGAQFSLTTFDSATVQRVPLTSDATALVSAASSLTPEVSPFSQGSRIDEPLAFMTELLVSARQEHPDRTRVLFYLGDGEQTRQSAPQSFAPLAPFLDGGAVLGYGSDQGGPMRVFDGYRADDAPGDPRYIVDPATGEPAISIADQEALRTIASQLGVQFLQRQSGDGVDAAVAGIDVGDVQLSPATFTGPVEFYWIAAIPLGLLALREVVVVATALAATRRRVGAGDAS